MNQVKVNSKFFINPNQIKRICADARGVWVHMKSGYPRILRADCSEVNMKVRIANVEHS